MKNIVKIIGVAISVVLCTKAVSVDCQEVKSCSLASFTERMLESYRSNDALVRFSAREAIIAAGAPVIPILARKKTKVTNAEIRSLIDRISHSIKQRKLPPLRERKGTFNALRLLKDRKFDIDYLALRANLSFDQTLKLEKVVERFTRQLHSLIETALTTGDRNMECWKLFLEEARRLIDRTEAELRGFLGVVKSKIVMAELARTVKRSDSIRFSSGERLGVGAQDFTFDDNGAVRILGTGLDRSCQKGSSSSKRK